MINIQPERLQRGNLENTRWIDVVDVAFWVRLSQVPRSTFQWWINMTTNKCPYPQSHGGTLLNTLLCTGRREGGKSTRRGRSFSLYALGIISSVELSIWCCSSRITGTQGVSSMGRTVVSMSPTIFIGTKKTITGNYCPSGAHFLSNWQMTVWTSISHLAESISFEIFTYGSCWCGLKNCCCFYSIIHKSLKSTFSRLIPHFYIVLML